MIQRCCQLQSTTRYVRMCRPVLNARAVLHQLRRFRNGPAISPNITRANSRLRFRASRGIAMDDEKNIGAYARDLGNSRACFPFTSERG